MNLLAAVTNDGDISLAESLIQGLTRLRRGMTAVVVTPSTERDWVRPLAALRGRGVGAVVCLVDALAYEEYARAEAGAPALSPDEREHRTRSRRAIRHALAEYDLMVHTVIPERALGELLVSRGAMPQVARR
jgi:hypothetical protein